MEVLPLTVIPLFKTLEVHPRVYIVFNINPNLMGKNLTVTWTQVSQVCPSSLCTSRNNPPSTVDLTQEGQTDWVHWGANGPTTPDRKKNGSGLSNYSTTPNTFTPSTYNNNPVSFSWSDGTPTASNDGTPTGIYSAGVGKGFTLTALADTTPRLLRLYVGVYQSTGKLTVEISDGSGTWTDTSIQNTLDTTDGVYVIRYKAKSANQSIRVTWTQLDGDGNVTLQAATLALDADSGNLTLQAATLAVTTQIS